MAKKAAPAARPDGITEGHVAERGGMHRHASLLSLLVLGAIVAWGASGYAGGLDNDLTREAEAARLHVFSPAIVRNGQVFEARLEVQARRRIAKLVIAISPSLRRDTTTNSMTPAAGDESFEDDLVRFAYGPLEAGRNFAVKIDSQTNPSLWGRNAGRVVVFDGDRPLVELPVAMLVLP